MWTNGNALCSGQLGNTCRLRQPTAPSNIGLPHIECLCSSNMSERVRGKLVLTADDLKRLHAFSQRGRTFNIVGL